MPVSDNNKEREIRKKLLLPKAQHPEAGCRCPEHISKGEPRELELRVSKERENIQTEGLVERHFLTASANNSKGGGFFSFFLLR